MNVKGTLNVLNAALKADVERVLLASSSWVCGAQEGDMVNEKSPFHLEHINTIYGASKISQEILCFSFFSEYKGPHYTVFRYGIPYGERMWRGLVVRAFMEMAERTAILSIMGDGKQFREFMYVGDLAEAHLHALKPDRREQDLQPDRRPPDHDRGDRQGGRQAFPGQDRLHPPGAGRAQDQARPQLAGRERAGLGAQDDARGRHPPAAPSGGGRSPTSRRSKSTGVECSISSSRSITTRRSLAGTSAPSARIPTGSCRANTRSSSATTGARTARPRRPRTAGRRRSRTIRVVGYAREPRPRPRGPVRGGDLSPAGRVLIFADLDLPQTTDLGPSSARWRPPGGRSRRRRLPVSPRVVGHTRHLAAGLIGRAHRFSVRVLLPRLKVKDPGRRIQGVRPRPGSERSPGSAARTAGPGTWRPSPIARANGLPIAEIPIDWNERHEAYATSVKLLRDAWEEFTGILRIRRALRRGVCTCSNRSSEPRDRPPSSTGSCESTTLGWWRTSAARSFGSWSAGCCGVANGRKSRRRHEFWPNSP